MQKEGTGEQRSSACPSPTTLSTTSSATNMEDDSKPQGTRIVNGQILRPDDSQQLPGTTAMLADRTGATGVQKNAAIPVAAPEVDYWAVAAGDGARLDGKAPATLKDKQGNEVDIRKLRAEAAAKRAEAAAKANISGSGKTVSGQEAPPAEKPASPAAPTSKRKTKIGSKYSRLKTSGVAFKGSANNLKK